MLMAVHGAKVPARSTARTHPGRFAALVLRIVAGRTAANHHWHRCLIGNLDQLLRLAPKHLCKELHDNVKVLLRSPSLPIICCCFLELDAIVIRYRMAFEAIRALRIDRIIIVGVLRVIAKGWIGHGEHTKIARRMR